LDKKIENSIVNVLQWINRNRRVVIWWILLALTVILFYKPLASFLSSHNLFPRTVVCTERFHWILSLIIFLLSSFFLFRLFLNYRLSKFYIFLYTLISIGYFFLRQNQEPSLISFVPYNSYIFYSDIILLEFSFVLILIFRNQFRNFRFTGNLRLKYNEFLYRPHIQKESQLKEDTPVEGDQIIQNEKIANHLIELLEDLEPQRAFVIGIDGDWGAGKTTLLKRIEFKIKQDSIGKKFGFPIMFWFNAWQHQGEKSIINNFFSKLKEELSYFSGDANSIVKSYLQSLLATVNKSYSNFFTDVSNDLFTSDSSLQFYYKNLNSLIGKIDRKIIVFIDDLDRLNKAEILEVLRILRNVANFQNIVFICGFDRSYIIKQAEFDNNYLDKIFNFEFKIPSYYSNNFIEDLVSFIENLKIFTEEQKKSITSSLYNIFPSDDSNFEFFEVQVDDDRYDIDSPPNMGEAAIPTEIPLKASYFFESIRDVKRFFNNLILNLSTLKNFEDVDLEDYILFRLVTFKYNWIHSTFKEKNHITWNFQSDGIKLSPDSWKDMLKKQQIEEADSLILYSALVRLFPNKQITEEGKNINHKRNFPIYYNNNVFNESYSISFLVSKVREGEIQKLIDEDDLKHKPHELVRIQNFCLRDENLINFKDFEQVVSLFENEYFTEINDSQMLMFIFIGEKKFKERFFDLINKSIIRKPSPLFTTILELRNYYIHSKSFFKATDLFFQSHQIKNFKFFDKKYTEQKVEEHFEYLINKNELPEEIAQFLIQMPIERPVRNVRLYCLKHLEKFTTYLRKNANNFSSAKEFKKLIDSISLKDWALLFLPKEAKKELGERIERVMVNKTYTNADLRLADIYHQGYNSFYDFILQLYDDILKNNPSLDQKEFKRIIKDLEHYKKVEELPD